MKTLKFCLAGFLLLFGLLIAWPLFIFIGGNGPVFLWALLVGVLVILVWFFFGRHKSGQVNTEGSLLGRQNAKEGLL